MIINFNLLYLSIQTNKQNTGTGDHRTDLTMKKYNTKSELVKYFTELRRTHFNGRIYTNETLTCIKKSRSLGIDLEGMGIYPIGFKE